MKSILPILLCFIVLGQQVIAQTDTLMANNTHTTALFFPSPIRQAITGAENFTFSYGAEGTQKLGLLQASPGPSSNLLVITMDEKAYMYQLRYEPELLKSYRYIMEEETITEPKDSIVKNEAPLKKTPLGIMIDSIRIKKGCQYVLQRSGSPLKTKRKNDIALRLIDMAHFGREVYLVIELENHSRIDFELDYLECYTIQGTPGRKSSFQKRELQFLYTHQLPDNVRAASENRFVMVVPKFTLGEREKLYVEVGEKHGSRRVALHFK